MPKAHPGICYYRQVLRAELSPLSYPAAAVVPLRLNGRGRVAQAIGIAQLPKQASSARRQCQDRLGGSWRVRSFFIAVLHVEIIQDVERFRRSTSPFQ